MTHRRLSPWRWLAPFALVAIALRMMPIALGETSETEALKMAATAPNLIEQVGETFPGSAYFFALGAFDPVARAANGLGPQWQGNKHILAIDIGPPAQPYRFTGRSAVDRSRALSCLTSAIYYEAANEPEEGQRAVAQVVLNRVRHPAWPNTVCGVVYEGTDRDDLRCQFTFSCNGAMARLPDGERWARARRVADAALKGEVFAPAGLATFYHTLTVFPGWATRMQASAIIGAHIFYRTPGPDGSAARFSDHYAGVETINGPSANAYVAPQGDVVVAPLIATAPASDRAAILPSPATPSTAASAPAAPRGLPESGDIRPEYRNSGRPLT